jgi:drug/metabolite transporter superfamily protein YnfA
MRDPTTPTGSNGKLHAAGGGLIVASLAPWASFLDLASASGLQVGFGWITLLAGATVITLAADPGWLRRRARLRARRRTMLTAAGIVSILDCLLVVLGASHSEYGVAIAPAGGVFAALACAIAVCLLARTEAAR